MRVITEATDAAWRSPVKAGPTRPIARATIQKAYLRRRPYNTEDAPGGDYDHERSRKGVFTNLLFGGDARIREIRNIRRLSWSRSVDQDVAEATMTILNSDVTPIGGAEEDEGEFEVPGLFTFNRGDEAVGASRWGYVSETGWSGVYTPDRVVKTYEGYGHDPDLAPGDDPNLYITGTWLIDEVSYNADGDIEITMRDLGRLLIDHIAFPPIVPWDDYPMAWSTIKSEEVEGRDVTGGSWGYPEHASATSSNNAYIGAGITDWPPYVGAFGGVQGHNNNDPITGDSTDFWISTGQSDPDQFVWWEADFDSTDMSAIRLTTVGGPYRIYVSLQRADGHWYGTKRVPYKAEDATEGVDIEAKIPFVKTLRAEKGEAFEIILKRKYANVTKIRITFTHLRRMSAAKLPWRAGLRKLMIYSGPYADLGFAPGTVLTPVGNYRDFTDIVKWVCAWSGFYWPASDQENYMQFSSTGPQVHYTYPINDSILPKGRVWGSFQNTGTAGVADLTADQFDKQPLLDCIANIREITGFSFWIDECGGPVWRMPNIYEQGNYVTPDHKHPRRAPARTTDYVTLDEQDTLMSYETRLSSRNLRERVFIGDSMGKYGTCIRGYMPIKIGLRRVAGWTDQNFKSNRECRVAADMVAAQQMFDWRRAKATTWGNPAIQIDDQIRIFERVTNETFYHYVLGISSTLDNDQGTWTYELTTHWLGERLSDAWVVRVDQLDGATQQYLDALGGVD